MNDLYALDCTRQPSMPVPLAAEASIFHLSTASAGTDMLQKQPSHRPVRQHKA